MIYGIVVILVFIFGYIMFRMFRKGNKKKQVKSATIIDAKLPEEVKKVLDSPLHRHIKPIICPECIAERINREETVNEDGEEGELVSTVLVFDSWIPYAAHLFQKHPSSTRISWAITCVKEERDKYVNAKLEIPKNIQILVDLIKSHGKTPIVDVGVPYRASPLRQEDDAEKSLTEPVDKDKAVEVVDDWGKRLG